MLPEVERLRPNGAIVTLGPEPEPALKFVERVAAVSPSTAIICASRDASPDVIVRALRAGARDFLRLPVSPSELDRKSTRLNSSHLVISYAVFCLKKKISC